MGAFIIYAQSERKYSVLLTMENIPREG